jgi:hypothetical protein
MTHAGTRVTPEVRNDEEVNHRCVGDVTVGASGSVNHDSKESMSHCAGTPCQSWQAKVLDFVR